MLDGADEIGGSPTRRAKNAHSSDDNDDDAADESELISSASVLKTPGGISIPSGE